MWNLIPLCETHTKDSPAPDEPFPNSVLAEIDRAFLKTLVPDDITVEAAGGFWQRQFGPLVTSRQTDFDWLFGLILPCVCFFFDPFIFREQGGLLAAYRLPVYMVSSLAIMATVTWLLWGPKLGPLNTLFAGLFAISGAVAALIGLILFPFSVIGMMALIGFLGFTPLFTSFVLFRNAVRAYRASII
jgi:hypothetical protein